jgi:hypothetical protein
MPTRVYKSIDPGAPVLRGSVGSLIAVLRACLVDGYGSLAPAGWSMPYTDGQTPPQRAHFRQAPRTGWPQCDLQVDDNISTADGAWETYPSTYNQYIASIAGWQEATALGEGSGRFPADGSSARVPKGHDTTTARPWVIVSNERGLLMWCGALDPQNNGYVFFFGDLIPHVASDALAVGLLAAGADKFSGSLLSVGHSGINVAAGSWTGSSSAGLTRVAPLLSGSGAYGTSGVLQWPNATDGKGYMSRLMLLESNSLRAILPAFWIPLHNWLDSSGIQHLGTFTGSGNLAGRSFIIIKSTGSRPFSRYAVAFETSDTWYVA